MAASAYLVALTWLARRELSTAQVRQRLLRRGFAADEVDGAVVRLTAERALDDARTAGALARTQLRVRQQGPARVRRTLEAAGLSRDLAARATADAYEDVDVDALLTRALEARWPPDAPLDDERTVRRLFRYLVSRGFDADRVLAALRARRRGSES